MSSPPLTQQFAEARAGAAAALAAGVDGVTLGRDLSLTVENIVVALADPAVDGAPIAVLATGGFGRQELAPYSDLDLLFLCAESPGHRGRAAADAVLYPLWDARIDAGHAVRSFDEALALPATDLAAATALLDARFLAGDAALAERFRAAFRARVSELAAEEFVRRLRAEQEARHGRFGDTIFLLEPDLKNGPGGLRDLCVGRWAAAARFATADPAQLAALGEMSDRQAAAIEAAREWLLRVRLAAHLAAGRRQDQLRFPIQEAIAPALYPDARDEPGAIRSAVAPTVEALMHQFQRHAKTVRGETQRLLERASGKAGERAASIAVTLSGACGAAEGAFVLRNGALDVADAALFDRSPREMVRLFAAAIELDAPLSARVRDLIADRTGADGPGMAALRADAEAARCFLSILCDVRDRATPSRLEEMQDLGLLAALMPEWEPTTGRVQHDIYHVYTVDQHSLYAVARMKALARGDLTDAHPTVTDEMKKVTRPVALALGTLLHDVGKPLGKGHSEKGAVLTAAIARQLQVDADDARRAELLVRQHLVMAHLSQRRDLEDQAMIGDFARLCGDEESLRELYLLTFCDLSVVAPGNLTEWKEHLLRGLFQRTLAYLRRGPDLLGADRAALVRRRKRAAAGILGEDPAAAELAGIFGSLPDRYFVETTPQRIAAHVKLIRGRQRLCIIDVKPRRRLGFSELVLVADDVPGLLADVTGVLLAHRVDVLDAAIFSRAPADGGRRGEALDLFRVRDAYGRAITDNARWRAIREDIESVMAGRTTVAAVLAARAPAARAVLSRRTPAIVTEVKVDNDVSREFTVVDVFTQDRPGVLHAITRTLHQLGLDIHRSKVVTEANRVADVFYVRDGETGDKITDVARLDSLRRTLAAALPQLY